MEEPIIIIDEFWKREHEDDGKYPLTMRVTEDEREHLLYRRGQCWKVPMAQAHVEELRREHPQPDAEHDPATYEFEEE